MGFSDWLRDFDVFDRLEPDRVLGTAAVVIGVIVYYVLYRWARNELVLAPFRAGLLADLDEVRHQAADVGGLDGLIERIETVHEALSNDTRLWDGASAYGALLVTHHARGEIAGKGSNQRVRGRARYAAAALGGDHSGLVEELQRIGESTGQVDEGDRDLVARAFLVLNVPRTHSTQQALTLHRKVNWLILTGLVLLAVLVIAFGGAAVVAFGLLGAFVSRIGLFAREGAPTRREFDWTAIMPAPVVGALAAFAGVNLVAALSSWGLLGETFDDVSIGSTAVTTLALAFVFGFSERLLDRLVQTASDRVAPATEPQVTTDSEDDPAESPAQPDRFSDKETSGTITDADSDDPTEDDRRIDPVSDHEGDRDGR